MKHMIQSPHSKRGSSLHKAQLPLSFVNTLKDSILAIGLLSILSFFTISKSSAQLPDNCPAGVGATTCADAVTLTIDTIGCESVVGSNEGAHFASTPAGGDPNAASVNANERWGTAPSHVAWFRFITPSAGWYTISTDNGDGDYGTDAQLALYDGNCTALTLRKANEDVSVTKDFPHYRNGFAAEITDELPADTFYVAVDLFGATRGKFRICVHENVRPANDDINFATDITFMLDTIADCRLHFCKEYCYNPPGACSDTLDDDHVKRDGPTQDAVTGDNLGPNNSVNQDFSPRTAYHDVWFKFNLNNTSRKNRWIDVFPNASALNGGYTVRYGALLYRDSSMMATPVDTPENCGTFTGVRDNITGLVYVEGSSGDDGTFPDNAADRIGGDRDKAKGNTFRVARIDLSRTDAGDTLPNGTYYLRVWQFTTYTENSDGGGTLIPITPPTDAILVITVEAASDSNIGFDGLSADKCSDADIINDSSVTNGNLTVDTLITCLSNAGMTGNVRPDANGDPPATDEPANFTFVGSPTGQDPCRPGDPVTTIYVGRNTSTDNNNSAFYKFVVNASADTLVQDVPCPDSVFIAARGLVTTLKNLICLLPVPPLACQTITTIDSLLQANQIDSAAKALICSLLVELKIIVQGLPDPPVSQAIKDQIKGLIDILIDLLCNCKVTVVTQCVPDVRIRLENIDYCGTNGQGINVHLFADGDTACGAANVASITAFATDECCLEIHPQLGLLANGTYSLAVNGDFGQVAQYDLHLIIDYVDPNTGLPCQTLLSPPPPGIHENTLMPERTKQVALGSISLNYIKPLPARNSVEVSYSVLNEGNVTLAVTDVTGRVRYTSLLNAKPGNNATQIDISSLSAGMYMLNIKGNDGVVFSKFVKVD